MKVAHLTTVDMSLRFLVLPQLQGVIEAGGEVVGISGPGPWVEELEQAGIRHIPLTASTRGMDPLADLKAAAQLWRILRRERFDIIHTHNPKPGLYGRVLGRLAGVPIVVNTVHGLYATPDDRWMKRAVVYLLEAIASRFSHAELVQNPEDLALLCRWRITPLGRTRLLGNGVDLARFSPDRFDSVERRRTRSELGVGSDQVVVGMVGRLVAEKGYPELFEAAARLDDRYVVVCVGPDDPDKSDALPRDAIERATAAGVRFLGMRNDVDRLYAAMDLFVLPSYREGFPRAAMEAAAMGLPIVATDIRGCRQVVDDGASGLLIPVGDSAALAAAVRRLGEDPDLRSQMSRAATERAVEMFDEKRVVEIVLDTYRRLGVERGLRLVPIAATEPRFRQATPEDAPFLSRLHADAISTGFLPQLGLGFLTRLYCALVAWPDAVVLVADDGEGPIGFVAGVADTGRFYRHFARRHGVPAGLVALPRLLRPSNLRRAWETLRYEGGDSDTRAELLSMAVTAKARGRGIGTRLGTRFLEQMAARNSGPVRVVVGEANHEAQDVYRRLGFVDTRRLEVHAGHPSLLLTWPG